MKKGLIKVKRKKIVSVFYWVMFGLLAVSMIYAIVMVFLSESQSVIEGEKVKSDYVLMITQCLGTMIILFLPSIIERKLNVDIPTIMEVLLLVFLYMAIILGDVKDFYYRYEHWDTILHFISGLGIGAIGFSIVNILNKSNKTMFNLKPLFVAFVAFSFALAIGMIWEIYEFTIDSILGTNMQKYMPENFLNLSPEQQAEFFREHGIRYALVDTMWDLVLDFFGALIVSVIGYILLKYKNGKLDNILIKIVDEEYIKNEQLKNQVTIEDVIKYNKEE